MLTTKKIDLNKFYKDGYIVAQFTPEVTSNVLAALKNQAWVPVVPDNIGTGERIDKNYDSRYISARSMLQPKNPDPTIKSALDGFVDWASPLLNKFDGGKTFHVSAFCGAEGYHMDAHTDAGDRAIIACLCYFGEDLVGNHDDGGCLDVYSIDLEDPEDQSRWKKIDSVAPKNGMIIVLNNMNPAIYHGVSLLTKPNALRYQLLAPIGMHSKPDWHADFEAESGFYDYHKKARLGDIEEVLEVLAKGTKTPCR